MQRLLVNTKKTKCYQPTDRPTDTASDRVACTRLEMKRMVMEEPRGGDENDGDDEGDEDDEDEGDGEERGKQRRKLDKVNEEGEVVSEGELS